MQFDIGNTGSQKGAEAAQVYVQQIKPRLSRPTKELKAFQKVVLNSGEKQTVSISLENSALAYYDPDKKAWVADADDFKILVGSSSRDIRLDGLFTLPETIIENYRASN